MTQHLRDRSPAGAERRTGSLARGGVANLVGAGVASVTNVLLVVVVTRSLPKGTAGTFFAATSVFLLVAVIARLGTPTGLVYFLSRARALCRLDRVRAVLLVGLTPVVVVAVLGAAVLMALAPQIASISVDAHRDEFVALLRWLAPFLPLAALTDSLLAATRGFGSMRPTVHIDKVSRSVLQLLLVALAVAYATSPSLAVAWAAPYVVAAAAAAWSVRKALRSVPTAPGSPAAAAMAGASTTREPAPRESTAGVARTFWAFTWPRTLSSAAQFALQRLDVIMIAALRGPAQAAVYTAATRFLVVGQLGAQSISSAAQPQLGEALARDDRATANHVYRTATAWLMLITWPLYLLAAIFAPLLLRVFGAGYSSGREVVVLLALAMLVATGCGMVDMLLTMAGRTSWNLLNTVLALAVNVGLNLLLIPRLGILGASLAWAAAILVNNLVPLAQVGLVLGLHPFAASTVRAGALALGCFGAVPGAVLLAGLPALPALFVSVALGALLYAGGCYASRDVLQLGSLAALRRTRPAAGRRDRTS